MELVGEADPSSNLVAAPSPEQYARNVKRVFGVIFFYMSSTAIALGPIFDAYLLNLGGKNGNALVGAVESTRGLLQLTLAYPIGVLSDRISRVRLLKYNLPFWTCGLFLAICGVMLDQIFLVFLGIVMYAPCAQCWNSSAQVMVADSVTPDKRTKTMSNMTSIRLLSNSLGPLLQVALLLVLRQNHWRNSLLRWVIAAGFLLWPGVVRGICQLDDLTPLEKTSRGGRAAASSFAREDLERKIGGVAVRWWMAVTLEIASFVVAIGAGMTVKFFPLFFRVDYKFSPIEVCLLSFVYPVCISATVQLIQPIIKRFGRLLIVTVLHAISTCCLWGMVYCRPILLVLPLYILRGALMNARGPVIRAVIMDLVTTEKRGRWNSIQSISSFTWSGSAALGGYLADVSEDYRMTFVITAMIYTAALLMYIPLLLIYPKEIRLAPASSPAPAARDAVVSSSPSAIALDQAHQLNENNQEERDEAAALPHISQVSLQARGERG